MFKCSCRRMKCDEESDAWNNLRISHIHVFLKDLGQHVPRKKNMEFAKVRRKKFFLAKMTFSRWKNLEQPSYIYTTVDIYIPGKNQPWTPGPLNGPIGLLTYMNEWWISLWLYGYPPGNDHISHLGKRKFIFKMPFLGDMLVPWRVN